MELKLEVYSPGLELIGVLEICRSVIWREYAFKAGSFSVESLITPEVTALLVPDNILWIEGNAAGIIEYVQDEVDENGPYITVKGPLLSGILERRILWGRYALYDTAEGMMYSLVDDCAVNPTRGDVSARKIPGLVLDKSVMTGSEKIRKQQAGGSLFETLNEIGEANQTAFGVHFNAEIPQMEFWARQGVNRTINQNANEPVFYSTELDDVLSSEYTYDSSEWRNVTLIAGEGEGDNRVYVTVEARPKIPVYAVLLSADPLNGGAVSGGGTFEENASVTVTAVPNAGYVFVSWKENGATVSTDMSYAFEITDNRILKAVFAKEIIKYTIITSAEPAGGGTVSGGGTFEQGRSITVTAKPAKGYVFSAWKENGITVSSNSAYTFELTSNRNLKAVFAREILQYTVITSVEPAGGGTVSGGGTFDENVSITVTATPVMGYVFSEWRENGATVSTDGNYTFTLTTNRNLKAVFAKEIIKYIVTTSVEPDSGGTTSGGGTFDENASVTVTATPSVGYVFSAWKENGAAVSTDSNYTFTLTTNRNLTAVFAKEIKKYTVAASTEPSGGGSALGGGAFDENTSVTVTATPSAGYIFSAWTENGATVSTDSSYTFTLTANRNLTAVFAKEIIKYTIATSVEPSGGGLSSGGGTFEENSSVTVTATPSAGYIFSAWTENGATASTNSSYTFIITGNRNLTAVFAKKCAISLSVEPSNGGTASGGGEFFQGTSITVKAVSGSGYKFTGWRKSGAIVNTSESYTFTVTEDASLTAVFAVKKKELVYRGIAEALGAARSNLAAITVGNYALFGGGSTGKNSSIVDAYDRYLTRTTPTEISTARTGLAAAAIGNYALFGGGYTSNGSSVVDAYDRSLTRTTPTALSKARTGSAATAVGGYALFGGGRSGKASGYTTYTSTVDAYDSSLTLTKPTALNTGRISPAATTVGNYALFGGGSSGVTQDFKCYSVVDAYDDSLTHTKPTSLSAARNGLAAATIGNYALFGGGYTGKYSSVVDAYDRSLTRTTPTGLSAARTSLAAVTLGDYALFGGGKESNYSSIVDAYDRSLTRTTPTALSKARSALAAVTLGNYALFGGGQYGSSSNSSVVDIYAFE